MSRKKTTTQTPENKGPEKDKKKPVEPVKEKETKSLEFPLVGIGASAGGLEALQEFFKHMPDNPGTSFVIVQHLSPDYKSLMDELLARVTNMKINRVKDGMKIHQNQIYLIPPSKNMTIFNGKLFLDEQDHSRALNLPIDIFLRSLAKDQGKNAIGIILSGTGSDGTLGIRAVKEYGGMVMAQDDRSAKFDGMPRSSISTGMVDYILPPAQMPEELINFIQHPFIRKVEKIESQISDEEDYLTKIIMILRDRTGTDFSSYKQNTIIRRLEKRISINRFDTIEDYANFLANNKHEANLLYKELLIGVTKFFRDEEAFKQVKNTIFPELIKKGSRGPLRVWTIGCSTGEEAYSLAILLKEYMEEEGIHREVKLFATDLDNESVQFAGTGIYPESIVSDITPERLSKYFNRKDEGYQVNETIRSMVIFAQHNILRDPPFSKIDLVSCRNMLIYLNSDIQKQVLTTLYVSMNENSYLFLGTSESVGELTNGFELIDPKWKIYKYKKGYRPSLMENFVVPSSTRKKRDLKTVGTYFTNNKSKPPKLDHIFDELLGEFIPPSVIIDENYDVIHTILKVNKYLSIPVGSISLNLLKMLPEEMAVMVSSLLRKAKKSSKEVIFRNLTLGGEEKVLLDVSGKMLQDKRTKEIYYIVSFLEKDWDNREQETEGGKEKIDIDFQYKERIAELEKELQYKSESLQATVEELETSNEELQSSNEELIASNEELQSTNEELQSVNEELYTVNSEYQKKLEELQELNSDMDNLLKNTNIGSLFLDQNLHIRKFTAVASKITNIMDADIGRPIHHISLNHLNNDFLADIDEVIDSLQKKESKIKTPDNYWYLVKIVPYRTAVNAVDGIIITFIDITHEVEMEQEKKKTHDLIYKTLEYNPVASTIVDKSGVITFANKKAEELFGISQKQIKERTYDASDWEITDPEGNEIDPTLLPFQQVMKTKKPVYRYQHYIKIPGKSKKLLSINGAPMFDDKGEITGVVFTLDDVTKEKEIEQQLKESEEKYKSLFNSNYDAILVADTKRKIIDANPAFERLTGYKTAEVKGRQTSDLYASENDFNKMGEKLKKFSDREGFLHVINYQKKDGTVFKGETTAFPLKNKNGNIRAFVGIIRKLNN